MPASKAPLADRRRNGDFDTHLNEARAEDARFMLDNGEHIERVARRLGMTMDALTKMLERTGAPHATR